MILNYNNIWCNIEDAEAEDISVISDHLTYVDEKAKHTTAYKRGRWSGKRTLFYRRFMNFPAGLIEYVIDRLIKESIPYELIDNRPDSPEPYYQEVDCIYKLRYHQKAAIKAFLNNKDGARGIFQLPTRAGKSLIGGWLMIHLGLPSLFIVPDKRLLHQTREEFHKIFGIECGVLGDSTVEPKLHNVATINTVSRYLKEPTAREDKDKFNTKASMITGFLNRVNFVIIDECHRSSNDYQLVYRNTPRARWRLGLSATPLMGSEQQILKTTAITGPLIYKQEVEVLAKKGLVVKPTVIFLRCNHTPSDSLMDWQEAYSEGIVYNTKRNNMIVLAAFKMHKRGKRVLILVEAIEQGEAIRDTIRSKGYSTDFIYGNHSGEERAESIIKLQNKELDILVASRVYNEGIDIPMLDCVIIGGGYKSAILTYQRYGRGMTKQKSKKETIVIDFFDQGSYFLEKHSQERISLVMKEKAFKIKHTTIGDL